MRAIHAFIVACMALMLCGGCFKYSQEIWINGDYSARIVTDFGLAHQISALSSLGGQDPVADMRQQYEQSKADLAADKNFRQVALSESDDEDYHYFKFEADVRDVTQLGDASRKLSPRGGAPGGGGEEAPSFGFTREPGHKLRFSMPLSQMAQRPDDGGEPFGGMGKALALSMLSGRYFTVTLHAPKILETNGELSADGKTATWKYSLAGIISGEAPPADIEAVIAMPNPLVPILLIGGGIVVLVIIVLLSLAIVRRRRRAGPAPAPPEPPAPA